uniref:Ig-like domain-containing protein n=1 Tax=Oryzias latipes TaxID=8090 RepID=A0A3P9I9K4_ORYLA
MLPCLITVSLSEFVIEEVQHGGQASLLCSNLSTSIINISWFKMDKRANTSRSSNRQIASMCTADSNATVQEEFKNGRFQMSTNTTHVFLNITKVDLSDSGMYCCGFYINNYFVIFDATILQVKVTLMKHLNVKQSRKKTPLGRQHSSSVLGFHRNTTKLEGGGVQLQGKWSGLTVIVIFSIGLMKSHWNHSIKGSLNHFCRVTSLQSESQKVFHKIFSF